MVPKKYFEKKCMLLRNSKFKRGRENNNNNNNDKLNVEHPLILYYIKYTYER